MISWSHTMCDACWAGRFPRKEPVKIVGETDEPCCYCQTGRASGIYIRDDPHDLPCRGEAGIHREEVGA